MIEINVPGYANLSIGHLVLDYNGTLAVDGVLLPGVQQALNELAQRLCVHVVTADTFGRAQDELKNVNAKLTILGPEGQSEAKRDYVIALGKERTASIGNGRNDRLMLEASALGIALVQTEGSAAVTCQAADVICLSILDALALLQQPKRLIATLRG
ncbi:MAG TPA: ATPase P [Candidatus Riflebacteria bacterium]|nr:ATPase P [Candidatus Riflebacteria bacterium]